MEEGVKSVEQLLEEKRRAELSARIASGEFTVEQSGYALYYITEMKQDPFDSRLRVYMLYRLRIVSICLHGRGEEGL